MNKFAVLIIVALIVYIFFADAEKWEGFYYPNGCLSCESDYIYSPIFEEKQQCLDWANDLKTKRRNPLDDFECGLNCKKENGFNICKETVDS